jgi:monomeric isocitrate dehydrogenase
MVAHQIPVISKFLLLRRLQTLETAVTENNTHKVESIIDNTIETIDNRESTEVHEDNLRAYIKNIEMALLLCYTGVHTKAIDHLHMASDVIVRDLAVMTPAYIMANRLLTLNTKCGIDKNKNRIGSLIGTLNDLPHDIVHYIGEIVNTN